MKTADLHLHTHFSDGTFSPEELAARARAQALDTIALTDHDTLDGCPRMAVACAAEGLDFIPGAAELGVAPPACCAVVCAAATDTVLIV